MYRLFLNLFLTMAKKSNTSSPEVVLIKRKITILNLTYNTECNNLHVPQQQTRKRVEQKTKNIKKNKKISTTGLFDWLTTEALTRTKMRKGTRVIVYCSQCKGIRKRKYLVSMCPARLEATPLTRLPAR